MRQQKRSMHGEVAQALKQLASPVTEEQRGLWQRPTFEEALAERRALHEFQVPTRMRWKACDVRGHARLVAKVGGRMARECELLRRVHPRQQARRILPADARVRAAHHAYLEAIVLGHCPDHHIDLAGQSCGNRGVRTAARAARVANAAQ